MNAQGIFIESYPHLDRPVFIAGFDGWGNALDVSKGTALYLRKKLRAEYFAKLNPDHFYRYDESRPQVSIEKGDLNRLTPPGGSLYAIHDPAGNTDLIVLEAQEPHLCWYGFADALLSLCEKMGARTIVTLGSMYDSVLHTDQVISGIATNPQLFEILSQKNILPISYDGPSAVHSIIYAEANARGFESASLWCHCPYYLQGVTHFGQIAALGNLLSSIFGFDLDTRDLEQNWEMLKEKIQEQIEKNEKLQEIVTELRKAKVKGSWAGMKTAGKTGDKIINLQDFLEPR